MYYINTKINYINYKVKYINVLVVFSDLNVGKRTCKRYISFISRLAYSVYTTVKFIYMHVI